MTTEQEAAFSLKIRELADMGFGLTKSQLLAKAGEFCLKAGLSTPFKDGPAGPSWYRGFMKRHKELSLRRPSKLSTNRGRAMDRKVVDAHFKAIGKVIENMEPQQIWNMDESEFNLEHIPSKVICEKGQKSVNSRVSSDRQNITVVACINAAGMAMPPMFIAKGKTHKAIHAFSTTNAPPGSVWTYQEKAWMEDSLGVQWFKSVFLMHCGPERPQVLIMDQHHSHEAEDLLDLAKLENITLFGLPPHTSQFLQPLDRGCFSSLTNGFNKECSEHMSSNVTHVVNKASFATLFCRAWGKAMTPSNIRSGFAVTGICPYNPQAIPEKAYKTAERGTSTSPVPTVDAPNSPQMITDPRTPSSTAVGPRSIPSTVVDPRISSSTAIGTSGLPSRFVGPRIPPSTVVGPRSPPSTVAEPNIQPAKVAASGKLSPTLTCRRNLPSTVTNNASSTAVGQTQNAFIWYIVCFVLFLKRFRLLYFTRLMKYSAFFQ